MTAIAARRFFLGETGGGLVTPEMMDLQNIHDFTNDPMDRERLKFVYQPGVQYGIDGRSFVPQNTDMYGQTAGGSTTGNGMYIPNPRQTPYNDMSGADNNYQCPYGFYRYGNLCVPSAAINPDNPNSIFQDDAVRGVSKGILSFVQPPRVTYLNQPFQIAAKIMNVGGKPGKYAIRTTISALNIADSLSGSVYLNPNQEGWLYQTISFANSTPPTDRIIQAKVDLVKLMQIATGGDLSYQLEDSQIISIPGPLASTMPVGPPQGLPIDNFTNFPQPNPWGGPPPMGGMPPMGPPPHGYPFPNPLPSQSGTATIKISPEKTKYTSGDTVVVYGTNFYPFESVSIKFHGGGYGTGGISIMGIINIGGSSGGTADIKTTQCDPLGRLQPVTMVVPRSTTGAASVTATGSQSSRSASKTISVNKSKAGGISIFG